MNPGRQPLGGSAGPPSYAVVSELKFVSIYDSNHNLLQTIGKKCPWVDEILCDLEVRKDIQDDLNLFLD